LIPQYARFCDVFPAEGLEFNDVGENLNNLDSLNPRQQVEVLNQLQGASVEDACGQLHELLNGNNCVSVEDLCNANPEDCQDPSELRRALAKCGVEDCADCESCQSQALGNVSSLEACSAGEAEFEGDF